MDKNLYGAFERQWDDRNLREWTLGTIKPEDRLLDIGAGRGGKPTMNFKDHCAFTAGIDPGDAVFENPALCEAKLQEAPKYAIPYEDNSFNVIVCNSVIEHITDPAFFFSEVARVLKPGGSIFAKTPNKYHYVAFIARFTPFWFHEFYNWLRGVEDDDTFPTTYPCNSRAKLTAAAKEASLDLTRLEILEARPEYLRLSFLTYIPGVIYEKFVNAFNFTEKIRCVIIFQMTKPNEAKT